MAKLMGLSSSSFSFITKAGTGHCMSLVLGLLWTGLTDPECRLKVSDTSWLTGVMSLKGFKPFFTSDSTSMIAVDVTSLIVKCGVSFRLSAVCGRNTRVGVDLVKETCRMRATLSCNCSTVSSVDEEVVRCLWRSFFVSVSSTCTN